MFKKRFVEMETALKMSKKPHMSSSHDLRRMSASKGDDEDKWMQKSPNKVNESRFFLDAEIGIKFALHVPVHGHGCMYACFCAAVRLVLA